MSYNNLEEKAKELYKYIKTKEGDMPDMEDEKTKEALRYMFDKGYLIKSDCSSPKATNAGDNWAYN